MQCPRRASSRRAATLLRYKFSPGETISAKVSHRAITETTPMEPLSTLKPQLIQLSLGK